MVIGEDALKLTNGTNLFIVLLFFSDLSCPELLSTPVVTL